MEPQIAKINQSLNTAEDMRCQTQLIMQPNVRWEAYLTPAPLSIAVMAELACLSSTTDFSINKNPPKDGYKYIKHPDSFQACVMQVCNSGWWAFNDAHKNMDRIRLHTLNVPDYMKTVVKILFQGSNDVVQAHLPGQLENIREIAGHCLKLANATEERFAHVINIIHELLEACSKARNLYTVELNEVKKTLEESKLREESSKEATKRSQRAVKAMEEELNEAREGYNQAMKSLPGGWEMIAMDFVGALTDGVAGVFQGLLSLVAHPVTHICNASTKIASTVSHIKSENAADPVDEINIYSKSAEILKCTESIEQFVQEDKINWEDLYDQKNNAVVTDFQAMQFKRILRNLKKFPKSQANYQAQNVCEEGIKICNELAKYAPDGKCKQDKTAELIERIQELTRSAYIFDSKSKSMTRCPPLTPKPPMMFKEESKMKKMSASRKASLNARFRIEQSRAQMNKVRELYDKSVDSMEENEKELMKILITMRNCQVQEIDFNTTIKMLSKGLGAMGRVKQQWENMVLFFQMVSSIVEISLNNSLKHFALTAEKTNPLPYNDKLFCKDLLYNQAFQATNIASLVHKISATYTEMSSKYLMNSISSLGTLLTMDKNSPEFLRTRVQLQESCDMAQKYLSGVVQKNQNEFENNIESRMQKIETELLAILPAATPKEIRRIEETVERGFTDADELQYV